MVGVLILTTWSLYKGGECSVVAVMAPHRASPDDSTMHVELTHGGEAGRRSLGQFLEWTSEYV